MRTPRKLKEFRKILDNQENSIDPNEHSKKVERMEVEGTKNDHKNDY